MTATIVIVDKTLKKMLGLDTETDLTIIKAEKFLEIKAEAERRIGLLDWRLERAREREALGIIGYETVTDIYQEKESIRQWSDQLEAAVMQLDSIDAVSNFPIVTSTF